MAYCDARATNEQTSSAEHPSDIHNVATAPELETDPVDEVEDNRPVHRRQRSHSAPAILYQQVALQLRDISDEFNREFSRDEVRKQFIMYS